MKKQFLSAEFKLDALFFPELEKGEINPHYKEDPKVSAERDHELKTNPFVENVNIYIEYEDVQEILSFLENRGYPVKRVSMLKEFLNEVEPPETE